MNTGNKDTMPCHQWVSAVIDAARVSVEDMERYATRRRLHLWFDTGEAISGAVDMLKRFVDGGKRADRADGEIAAMRQTIRTARIKEDDEVRINEKNS